MCFVTGDLRSLVAGAFPSHLDERCAIFDAIADGVAEGFLAITGAGTSRGGP